VNWTSKLRSEAGHLPFIQKEKEFSDFTYYDTCEYMKEMLRLHDAETDLSSSSNTTIYHLEVKTTTGSCDEPCFVSQNQVDMVGVGFIFPLRL
jgi:hypothetical protein